jgi:NADH-quinone oxidoreductase subunit J
MTTRPQLIEVDRRLLAGLIPLGLFAVVAAIALTTEFGDPQGFAGGGLTVVEDIGYALIGAPENATLDVEDFVVALILIAVLLDAALDGALMLATRDDGGED